MLAVGHAVQYFVFSRFKSQLQHILFIFCFPMTFYVLSAVSFGLSARFGKFLMELFSLRIISIVYIWCCGLVKNGY